jgi:hypothetical protein
VVEIEEVWNGKFGALLDGNEPNACVVQYLATKSKMDEFGIDESMQLKHGLNDYYVKFKMKKPELWKRFLSAFIEHQITWAGGSTKDFDVLFCKPEKVIPEDSHYKLLAAGVSHTYERRRTTYAQMAILCPESHSKIAKLAFAAISDLELGGVFGRDSDVYFSVSEPIDYDDYIGFEKECREFVREIMNNYGNVEAYRKIGREAGIRTDRILPL